MIYRIFTDGGAFKKTDTLFRSVSAYRLYKEYTIIHGDVELHEDKTNNYAEIYAIAKGLRLFLDYIQESGDEDYKVELYSDSLLCVNSLTKWIFKWVKGAKNGVFYNSNGVEVANQELIKEAFKYIVKLKGKIKIYHINSHQPTTKLQEMYKKFKKFNKCDMAYDDFVFAYYKNKECDEAIQLYYKEYMEKQTKSTLQEGESNN